MTNTEFQAVLTRESETKLVMVSKEISNGNRAATTTRELIGDQMVMVSI